MMFLISYTDDISTKINKHLYDKGDHEGMRKFLADKDWLTPLQGDSVEDQWKTLSELIYEAVRRFVPNIVLNCKEHQVLMWFTICWK